MKFVLSALTLAFGSVAVGQEPPAPSPQDWKIYVEMKVFAASARKLNPLVDELRDEAKVNDAAGKLEKMVESGEAELVGTIASQTIENHQISAFQGEQVRYSIEFERPDVIEGKNGQTATPAGRPQDIAYPATTYETRDVGLSLELDMNASADGHGFIAFLPPRFQGPIAAPRLPKNHQIDWRCNSTTSAGFKDSPKGRGEDHWLRSSQCCELEKGHSEPRIIHTAGINRFLGDNPFSTERGVAAEILSFRKSQGLTQTKLARMLQIDPQTLGAVHELLRQVSEGREK